MAEAKLDNEQIEEAITNNKKLGFSYDDLKKKIEEQGWKFIRYSMFNKFPSIEQIRDSIKTIIEQEEKS